MRHLIRRSTGKLGALLCALLLASSACDEPQEPTGLEVEESEVERGDDGQIEEAEVELEREEVDEIDQRADEDLVESMRGEDQQAQADQQQLNQPNQQQMDQPNQPRLDQSNQQAQADQQQAQADQQQAQADQQQAQADQQQQNLTAVIGAPSDYTGSNVKGTAMVGEVPTDRGFWLTDGENRIFAVVREYDERIDINQGQQVELEGQVHSAQDIDKVEGPLDADTKQIIESQDAFVAASHRNIQIVEGAVGGGPAEKDQTQPSNSQQDDAQ